MAERKHRGSTKRSRRGIPIFVATRGALIAAASMILGLVQIVMLLRLGTGAPTDAYFYVLAWSVVPVQLALVSFYYPLLLRRDDLGAVVRARIGAVAAVGTIAAVAISTALYWQIAGPFKGLGLQCLVGAAGTLTSVFVWMRVLRQSAEGNPGWLAGVNLLPSLLAIALLGTFGSRGTVSTNVVLMLVGQGLGFVAYLGLMGMAAKPTATIDFSGGGEGAQDTPPKESLGASWIAAQSVSAYGAILLLQTLAVSLPSSSLTDLGLANRIVASFSTLVSSSVLPVILNRKTTNGNLAVRFLWVLLLLETSFFCILVLNPHGIVGSYRTLALVITLWSLGVVLNLTLHRLAFRLHDSRLGLITIIVCVVVSIGAWGSATKGSLSLDWLLLAFVVLDLGSGILFAVYMHRRALAMAYSIAALAQGLYMVLG